MVVKECNESKRNIVYLCYVSGSDIPYNNNLYDMEVFNMIPKFNFFGKTNTNIQVKIFDMQDEADLMMYERINQNILENKNGWKIHSEDKYTDKHSNITILLKWEEPEVDYENKQRTS